MIDPASPTERRAGQQHNPEVQLAVLGTQMTGIVRDIAVLGGKVDALDVKVDTKTDALDRKFDVMDAKQQRADGVLAVVRWLGVGGVTVGVVALLKAFGAPLP